MTKNIRILLLIFFITSNFQLFAQRNELRTIFLEAESWFLFEEYPDALDLYLKIHEVDPENNNINYKIGVCYLNDPYQMEKSIPYLQKASENINPFYKENNFNERTAPPEALYYLGNAYRVNNNLDSAIYIYRQFLQVLDDEIYDRDLVEFQIKCCRNARDLMKKPIDIDIKNLGLPINTRYAEMNPILSGDGLTMVFVYKGPYQDAPYFTTLENGTWVEPRNIIPDLGVDGDVYPTCLSYDGKEMFIYRNDNYIGNLYHSRFLDTVWSPMEKLNENINTKYWESHASLSHDGRTLYFTSNRKGGFGGLDIYRSERKPDGDWGPASNLGRRINSIYNEETPFITSDDKTLYFSSYGHYNMGGYDIFYAKRVNDSVWRNPVNIGFPINTTDDNIFFFPFDNGKLAYYAMYRPEGYGRHDIYQISIYSDDNPRMYDISGIIHAEGRTDLPADVIVYVTDPSSGDTLAKVFPDRKSGGFNFELPKGNYSLLISSTGYQDLIKPMQINDLSDKNGIRLTDDLTLKLIPFVPEIFRGDESRILTKDTIITAIAGERISIPLRLDKGSILISTIIADSMIVSRDTLTVGKKRIDLEIIPLAGQNIINLRMIDEKGNIHLKRIIVIAEMPVVPKELPVIVTEDTLIEEDTTVIETDKQIQEAFRDDTLQQYSEIVNGKPPSDKKGIAIIIAVIIAGSGLMLLLLLLLRKRKRQS